MTDPEAQSQKPDPQGQKPWGNPMDAPPPFPQTGQPYSSHYQSPYTADPYAGPQLSRSYGGHRPDGDERMWAMIAHLSAPIAAVVSAGWLSIVGPLVVYLLRKDSSPFVRTAAAGAFNFQLTMWLVTIVGWILNITVIGLVIGIPLVILGGLGSIILGIVGAIKTWNGESYTYPWQIKALN